MNHLKQLNVIDPLERRAEKATAQPEYSPMDPPDAYAPPAGETVSYEALHPFLQHLMDEHKLVTEELEHFESILIQIGTEGITREINEGLSRFFRYLSDEVVRHQSSEEKILFPLLQRRLVESGEHSNGPTPSTAVDMLEDDHIKVMQLAAVAFNFMGLAPRLPDADSRALVLDVGLEQGKTLVELLRLHIFREDHIVFPLAHEHISTEELDAMESAVGEPVS